MHLYTQAFLISIPLPDPVKRRILILLKVDIPSPANPPRGFLFHTCCQYAIERCSQCSQKTPELVERGRADTMPPVFFTKNKHERRPSVKRSLSFLVFLQLLSYGLFQESKEISTNNFNHISFTIPPGQEFCGKFYRMVVPLYAIIIPMGP